MITRNKYCFPIFCLMENMQ
uniref:Uncharacterized protein n=1 Tax=Arundo donax TaxID=35708 RepID=A0A0A9CCW0_ARUDO